MKLNEEIDTGQVLSAQDIADRRREREPVDNLPEVQALRRKVRQMRINMDNYPEGSKEEAELLAQIRANNQQIQKYYQQVNQLRSQYGLNQPKRRTIKMNEEQLRSLIAESVKGVLKEYGYDSYPESGYEPFKKIGEGAAYLVMDKLKKEYANDVDSEAIEHIISEFGYSLRALADVGDIDNGIKGFGIKS